MADDMAWAEMGERREREPAPVAAYQAPAEAYRIDQATGAEC